MKGILVDKDNDIIVNVIKDSDGMITQGMIVGESTMQETAFILAAKKGEFKEYPMLGAHLFKFIRSAASNLDIERAVRINLKQDGKDYDKLKSEIILLINKEIQ